MARSTDSWDESDVRIRPNKKGTRPRTKDRPSYDDAVTGRIITVDRGRYTAVVAEGTPEERKIIAARARELRRNPVVAGDFVSLVGDVSGEPDTLARLVKIQERKTLLRRSADDTDPIERAVVITRDLAPGSVDLRLRGRDVEFVVTQPSTEPDNDDRPAAPLDLDDASTSRTTLRLPDALKARVDEAAAADGLSVNTWLVRAVATALQPKQRRSAQRTLRTGDNFAGWAR